MFSLLKSVIQLMEKQVYDIKDGMQRMNHISAIILATAILVGWLLTWQDTSAQPKPPDRSYEIWVTNQVTDSVQVFDGRTLRQIAEIFVDEDGLPATSKPHTISFSPQGAFAYVANVGAKRNTNNITVIQSNNRKIVAMIPAGPATHMVVSSPTGTEAFAANAGGESVIEILTNLKDRRFSSGRSFKIKGKKGSKSHPVCLAFSGNGSKLYVTNAGDPKGNPTTSGFLAVMSTATGREISRISNLGSEACGLARSRDGGKIFFTNGGKANQVVMLDTKTDRIIKQIPTGGQDPHGLMLIPGGHQIWITNRMSKNVTVLSTTTGKHYKTFFNIGDKPDLMAFSPDGEKVFITLRGDAVTPMPEAKGGSEPGFVILDTQTGRVLSKIPLEGDPHGIAVRLKRK